MVVLEALLDPFVQWVVGTLVAWQEGIRRLREIGRESKAEKLQGKLDRLQDLTQ
jgi:hypothetical protein